jgi:hypothetical protein
MFDFTFRRPIPGYLTGWCMLWFCGLRLAAQTDSPAAGGPSEYSRAYWLSSQLTPARNAAYAGTQARGVLNLRAAFPPLAFRGFKDRPGAKNRLALGLVGEGRLFRDRLGLAAGADVQHIAYPVRLRPFPPNQQDGATTLTTGHIALNWCLYLDPAREHRLRVGAGLGAQHLREELLVYPNDGYGPRTLFVLDYHLGAWYTWKGLQAGVTIYNIGEPRFRPTPAEADFLPPNIRPFALRWDLAWAPDQTGFLSVMPVMSLDNVHTLLPPNFQENRRDTTYKLLQDLSAGFQLHLGTYGMLGFRYNGRQLLRKNGPLDDLTFEAGARYGRFRFVYTLNALLNEDPLMVHVLELQARF